jgi:hypothetical protein
MPVNHGHNGLQRTPVFLHDLPATLTNPVTFIRVSKPPAEYA